MPRYIDADALKDSFKESYEKLKELYDEAPSEGFKEIIKSQMIVFMEAILRTVDTPTADVVEVVRCAQCKHKRIGRNSFGVYFYCGHPSNGLTNIGNVDKDFCSYGERRNDG